MALISTLPNFFNAAAPVQSDFNNAAKALAGQIGGTYYDEAQSAYVSSPGNLDTTNLAASPGLRNSQKAEPWSPLIITRFVAFNSSFWTFGLIGPFPVDVVFTGFSLLASNDTGGLLYDNYVTGGSANVAINGSFATSIYFTIPGHANGDAAFAPCSIPVAAGSRLDFGENSGLGGISASGMASVTFGNGSPIYMQGTWYGKCLHVR